MTHTPSRRALLARIALSAITTTMAGAAIPALAQAQTGNEAWPSKPVRMITPSGPGSQGDLLARYIADHLAKVFNQPFLVENRPGGSGSIGALAVAKAPADGHTLLFTAASFTIVPQALSLKLPYDLMQDLAPIAQIGAGGQFLAVGADFPAKTLEEFVALVRAKPNQFAYGTGGNGSTGHLNMAAFVGQQDLKMMHVPYKGVINVLNDMLAGVLPIGMLDTTSSLPMLKAGRIRALGLTGSNRAPLTPEVPTFAERGMQLKHDGWMAMFSTAGTPEAVVRRINAEVNRLLQSAEAKARLTAMNLADSPPNTPEQFTQTLRADLRFWTKVAKDNDVRSD